MTDDDEVPAVTAAALLDHPAPVRERLLALRRLVLDVAASTGEAGPAVETLKWGQASFLPSGPRVGTPVRLDRVRGTDDVAVLVHCRTTLVDEFRHRHGARFRYDGTRAIVLSASEPIPEDELRGFVREAFSYRRRERRAST
ncbi:DUF1801 domain-containing protein [Demequina mangrovi]|uniref:YdhG-like domain-containing protein n=1 Tax=Demequina mangrovi TaxID=1043493 RepID=A0A1H6XZF8_9MICO|nr:DUF1801 domain-containing protein [Demequina mangrovi]SEJ32157.1 hypothetical protein SAMN05421637_1407 [Demequina mangrovi]